MNKKITSLLMVLFTILGFSQDNQGKIQNYLEQNKAKFNLTSQDISDWFIQSTGNSESTKIDYYYILQRHQGIEIHNALSNVWIKNDEIIKSNFSSEEIIKMEKSIKSKIGVIYKINFVLKSK